MPSGINVHLDAGYDTADTRPEPDIDFVHAGHCAVHRLARRYERRPIVINPFSDPADPISTVRSPTSSEPASQQIRALGIRFPRIRPPHQRCLNCESGSRQSRGHLFWAQSEEDE